MSEESKAWLRKAERNLKAAENSLSGGFPDECVDRAYFAIFSAATAMGRVQGKKFPACSGWMAEFKKSVTEPNGLDAKFQHYIEEAYQLREKAVYDAFAEMSESEAKSTLDQATDFVAMAEEFLKQKGD